MDSVLCNPSTKCLSALFQCDGDIRRRLMTVWQHDLVVEGVRRKPIRISKIGMRLILVLTVAVDCQIAMQPLNDGAGSTCIHKTTTALNLQFCSKWQGSVIIEQIPCCARIVLDHMLVGQGDIDIRDRINRTGNTTDRGMDTILAWNQIKAANVKGLHDA